MPIVWVDLSNSPHVPFFSALVPALEEDGWQVLLTCRDHAQTVGLARREWPTIEVVGGASPPGRLGKVKALLGRSLALRSHMRPHRPDVALSHGSYAQLAAARLMRLPSVTMMDYEHQPANHLSFRLARRVVVPAAFPEHALRRSGGSRRKSVRYDGFKEDLYLDGFTPDAAVLGELGLDRARTLVVMRPAPEGALYHRTENPRFDQLLDQAREQDDVQVVVLPRTPEQAERYRARADVVVPERPVDGRSLLAAADLVIGAGGTMNREAALLGTPTYTVFGGKLAAVDRALMDAGLLHDLRDLEAEPSFRKKSDGGNPVRTPSREPVLEAVRAALGDLTRRRGDRAGT